MIFLEGYLLGLSMIVFIGPVFFLLLTISFEQGYKSGILVALGIIISDIVCVYICYFGIIDLIYKSEFKFWISIIGAILLIILGIQYLFFTKKFNLENKDKLNFDLIKCFAKGFLVNFVNPFVFFVWIGVISYSKEIELKGNSSFLFLFAVLLGILSTDLLKVLTSSFIKKYLTTLVLKNLYRISGFSLICFGLRMIYLTV